MVDCYTKTVLTVIAAALVTLAIQNFIRPLGAQSRDIQKVQICDDKHCAILYPRVTTGRGFTDTDWVLPTQIREPQRVQLCNDIGLSCADVDVLGHALKVSPR